MLIPKVDVVGEECSKSNPSAYDMLTGESKSMRELKSIICRISQVTSNVLITGETGTGKELVAELIHQQSNRSNHSLVCLNCAAIPESLLESELFGHKKGSFTGATSHRDGLFKQAHKGSLLLDEIGDMSIQGQAKILRALESKQIYPVGGSYPVKVDVRIIAATNQELEKRVKDNQFRADLFYRLNVARVQLPPLRERRGDIALLSEHFVHLFNKRFDMRVEGVSNSALELLNQYHWPGNVRQLKNILEASFINQPGPMIRVEDFPVWFCQLVLPAHHNVSSLAEEKHRLKEAMHMCEGNKSKAAKLLNCSRMTLYRKLHKHKICYNQL